MIHACAIYAGTTQRGHHRYGAHCGLVFDLAAPAPLESPVDLLGGAGRCSVCFPSTVGDEDAASLDPSLGGLEDANGLGEAVDASDMGQEEDDGPVGPVMRDDPI